MKNRFPINITGTKIKRLIQSPTGLRGRAMNTTEMEHTCEGQPPPVAGQAILDRGERQLHDPAESGLVTTVVEITSG